MTTSRFDFTFKAEEGYAYTPFTNGVAVGYVITAPNGKREIVFLNPSGGTDDGFADIAIYQGELDPDVTVDDDGFLADEKIYDPQAMTYIAPFDYDTTADALARIDLAKMSIGAEPTAEELELRTAEYIGRLKRNTDRDGPEDFMARERRESHHGDLLDLELVARWLHLYGVPATVEHAGGNSAVVTIAGGRVTLGPGWFEGTAIRWRAFAGTDDAVLSLASSPGGIRAQWTELETAWMAINILTSRAVFTYADDGAGARRPAKAAPSGPAITAPINH